MKRLANLALVCLLALVWRSSFSELALTELPRVRLNTSLGDIVVELFPEQAPRTVDNFLLYTNDGFYDRTLIHRVVPEFVIQGGGYDAETWEEKPTRRPIRNEANNGLKNSRGTVAMARTANPHSAASQFFINLDDNDNLDHSAKTLDGWGYCVFGRVIEGMDVADLIGAVPAEDEFPNDPIIIESIEILQQSARAGNESQSGNE
jgi:peptidyl-prolyl cis-trans isomerase B (cyclophilin B)